MGEVPNSKEMQGDSIKKDLHGPLFLDPHIPNKLFRMGEGSKLSTYLADKDNPDPIAVESARREIAKLHEERMEAVKEDKRDLLRAESMDDGTDPLMENYIGNLKASLERNEGPEETLGEMRRDLETIIKNLPEAKMRILLEAVEIEARIIQGMALGKAIARRIRVEKSSGEYDGLVERAKEYILDHITGRIHDAPAQSTVLFEDEVEDLLAMVEQKKITPTPDDYDAAEQVYDNWILLAYLQDKGLADLESLTLSNKIAHIAYGISNID